ncbi:GNAT family N-acetyltransferase [Micromonospora arborensis]
MINTPLPLAAPVGAELDARGWGARPPVLVQTAPLPLLTSASAGAPPTDPAAADSTGAGATGAGATGDDPPAADSAGTGAAGAGAAGANPAAADSAGTDAAEAGATEAGATEAGAAEANPAEADSAGTDAAETGLRDGGGHVVASADQAGAAGRRAEAWSGAVVELTSAPSEAWLTVAAGRKGGLPDAARHVLTAVDQVRFAHVYAEGRLVAIGRGTVTGQGRWLGLSLIEVLPVARRQGLARRLIHELATWGVSGGATHAFLQVEQRNTTAIALYQRLGFTTHHTYLTRFAPNSQR